MQEIDDLAAELAAACRVLQEECIDGWGLLDAVAVEAHAVRLELTCLGLMLAEAEVGEVGKAGLLEDEQAGVRVVRDTRIGRVEDEGFVECGVLFGGPKPRRHRLNASDVEWPRTVGIHLDRAPAAPAVQRPQPGAE